MSKKLNNSSPTPKSYWSILNWFLKNIKKTSIPPIFHNDKVIFKKDIPAIIKSLDPNKSQGWNISVKMIQTCRESLALPLKMIFEIALNDDNWWLIEGNIATICKKDLKNMLKSYYPICLFQKFANVFETTIFMSMFEHFIENELSVFATMVFFQVILTLLNS